jgi:hypothetical protein
MKTKLLALVLLAGGSLFAETNFSFGIGIGGYGPGYYAPPPPPVVVVPPSPGPDYVWIDGYWVRRPYRSYWVAPRYEPHRYHGGYWRRDFDRDRDRDRDRR